MAKPFETYYLDTKTADDIEAWVLKKSTPLNWSFNHNVAYDYHHLQETKKKWGNELNFEENTWFCPGFSCRLIHEGSEHPNFWLPGCIKNLRIPKLKSLLDSQYTALNIWRMQLWIYPSVSQEAFNQPHSPHVDISTRKGRKNGRRITKDETGEGNIVLLYYVNDADGDNFFYKVKDEYVDHPSLDDDQMYHPDLLEIVHTETPEKGKLLVMDGDVIHASSSPSKGIRSTLNINLLPKHD